MSFNLKKILIVSDRRVKKPAANIACSTCALITVADPEISKLGGGGGGV